MTGADPQPTGDVAGGRAQFRMLRTEVDELVRQLPAPVASVAARAGACMLEITFTPLPAAAATPLQPTEVVPPALAVQVPEAATGAPALADECRKVITSPIVGTFYIALEPGAPPFVRPGDTVERGQDVGIVEAMKLVNRIQSEWSGTVTEVLVADGHGVEFDQPLVVVEIGK